MTRYALYALCWMTFIFFLSSLPGTALGPDALYLDVVKKGGHVVLFGILSLLYVHAIKGKRPFAETGSREYLGSFLLTVLYAVSDEYHQLFTPDRHASLLDVLIDAGGAVIFLSFQYEMKFKELLLNKGDIDHG